MSDDEPVDQDDDRPSPPADQPDPSFERLLTYLKEVRAFDFTGYKRASLMRRVRHQMRQVGVDRFDDYLDHLQVHPDEFTALFDTILINVTSFFRDPESWDQLASEVLPALLEATGDDTIRVWSAGCATGQEAYSVAIMLVEALGAAEYRRRVKIYATDIDEPALSTARQAAYTDKEVKSLPGDYLGKYFEQIGGRYVFRADLRRNVIFGRNDLVQDAPISRIDLLSCRNTLMYFNAETQARIVARLGFALRPRGVLFLGKAEMLLNHATPSSPSISNGASSGGPPQTTAPSCPLRHRRRRSRGKRRTGATSWPCGRKPFSPARWRSWSSTPRTTWR
jgi:two-component system, chemotaxis family, CheB/CheR fusion protein